MKRILCLVFVLSILCTVFAFTSTYAADGVSIFGDISNEKITSSPDSAPINISSRFAVKVPGKITKARLYTSEDENGTYTVELWSVLEDTVIAGPFDWKIESGINGWQEFTFPEAVHVDAGHDYLIAIRNNEGSMSYSFIPEYFKNYNAKDSLFIVQDDGGLFTTSDAMPHLTNPHTLPAFLRDVVFEPDEAASAPKQDEKVSEYNSVYVSDLKLGSSYSFGAELAVDGGSANEDLVISSKTYEKGFAMFDSTHSGDAFVEINIEGLGFKTFASYVGVGDLMMSDNSAGSVVFIVEVDGAEVARSEVCKYGEEAILLKADITDGKVLRLSVSDTGDGKVGDLAAWGDCVISKSTEIEDIYKDISRIEEPEVTAEPTPEKTDKEVSPTPKKNTEPKEDKTSLVIMIIIITAVAIVLVVGTVIIFKLNRRKIK